MLPWQPIKFGDWDKIHMKHNLNIPIETKNNVNFHSSHYKSMENTSWFLSDRNKNTIYAEANVINSYAKYQLHPPKKIFNII